MGMGSVSEPSNYNFGANLQFSQSSMVAGRVDTDGVVMGRWQQDITENMTMKASAQASQEADNSQLHMELDYRGSNWCTNLKWGHVGIYGISFMQHLTPHLSMGLDTFYHQPQAISMLSGGIRYEQDTWVASGLITGGALIASFCRKTPRAMLATEIQMGFNPNVGVESTYSVGFEIPFKTSRLKAHVDTNWKVATFLEEALNPYSRFMLSAELDHQKKAYRFGFGVMFGV